MVDHRSVTVEDAPVHDDAFMGAVPVPAIPPLPPAVLANPVPIRRVVLFGAGASFGSGTVDPAPPPLGADLFGALFAAFPSTWGALPVEAARRFAAGSFETGMEYLWQQDSTRIAELMRGMAEFFARFRPASDRNLYVQFIHDVSALGKRPGTLFASLNYDLLLEAGVQEFGFLPHPWLDSSTDGAVPVLKLHGSCHFLPRGMVAQGIVFSAGVRIETGFRTATPSEVLEFCRSRTAFYPAMCLYMKGKPGQVGAAMHEETRRRWAMLMAAAERVLVIGVAPNTEDTHVWDPLGSTPARIAYVGGDDGGRTFESWCSRHRPGSSDNRFLGPRWGETFEEGIQFLAEC